MQSAILCTDLSGKEQYIQVGMERVVTSGRLGGVMISTHTRNARDVGSIPALGVIFRIFHYPHNTGCHDHVSVQARWLLNLPCVCIYIYIYICNCKP